ncbi:NAD(P)H-dependent oxidoreductase [Xanthovirga aplysinae]|uniref:NAD(P)H-dependent oxidoreductase n=1 Tax=Xanthovirga aplysinae TaxID=2529853 RepID=UPI0012BB710A|nr:NAD(P)H-dependent oxidoreductase [Xanthovirga aplysinae]MTI31938.1 NAD(P)H-dependent oxidoreductase [Xanthovirga aplysinae]
MDIIEKLNWRYATKRFDENRKLSDEKLNTVLEALRLSPTSYGLQAMKFVVVEDKALREELKKHAWNQPQVTEASHLIVLCREATLSEGDVDLFGDNIAKTRELEREAIAEYMGMIKNSLANLDEDSKGQWLARQVYIALGNLLTVCAVEEIDACPMEGFDPAAFDEILKLEEQGLNSVLVVPIGYRSTEDGYQNLAKVRKPLEEVIIRK